MSVLSLCIILPTTLALPHFWPHGYGEKPYPTMTISSSQGVYPTGFPGTTGTGTGTGTAYYPTATGSAYLLKREPDHPYGFPPPYKPDCSTNTIPTGMPTGVPSPTYMPTGSAPSASGTGTGLAYPTYALNKRGIDAARHEARQHFEGPRKHGIKPFYPYAPGYSYGGPTATGSGVLPTGTGVVPTGTIIVPVPSGTVSGGGYYSTVHL